MPQHQQARNQMHAVTTKHQKMVKCCHVWLGLFRQALAEGQEPVIETVDLEGPSGKGKGKEKRKDRTEDFVAPPPPKKQAGTIVPWDDQKVKVKATISAILEKQKQKTDVSKSSLSTGAKKGAEEVSTAGDKKEVIRQEQLEVVAQESIFQKINFLEKEHQKLAEELDEQDVSVPTMKFSSASARAKLKKPSYQCQSLPQMLQKLNISSEPL